MLRSPHNCKRFDTARAWPIAALLTVVAAPVSAHAPNLERELPSLPEYFRLGIEHILTGYDHLAFLIGLLLLAGSTRALLAAVTAFTVAHSLSLALAILGVVTLPSVWVEVAIALSIAYVGVENFVLRDGRLRWRITFVFGFVHGFGFAGALQEIGVPSERAPAALALFNLGVESGQLVVLAVAVPALAWLRGHAPKWPSIVRALNVALVAVGLGWALQRGLGGAIASTAVASDLARPEPEATQTRLTANSGLVSVYPRQPVTSERAVQLCALFQRLPRDRRAACSGGATGITLERECSRVLSAALASGALRIDEPAVDGCERQWRERYTDCAFTSTPALPESAQCQKLWQGQVDAGGTCRSALECRAGLTCSGVGPFDIGTCTRPKPAGASCGRSIDALAAYVPHAEAAHPECAGSCVNGRCREAR